MEGKKIEIHLHTPILVPSKKDQTTSHYEEAIQRIKGKVKQSSEAGILLEVSEFIGEKGEKFSPLHSVLFLPHHKIDHIYII